jgi:uncharacterized DUF497 family protein
VTFSWSKYKYNKNYSDHKIYFEEVVPGFDDVFRWERYDLEHSWDEHRFQTLLMVDKRIVFVVFTEPEDDEIRLISAREAEYFEEDMYYGRRPDLLLKGAWYQADS